MAAAFNVGQDTRGYIAGIRSQDTRMGELLRKLLQIRNVLDLLPLEPGANPMGDAKIQEVEGS